MILSKENFEKYYLPDPNTGCYLWLGGLDKGRAYLWHSHTKKENAYRVAYRLFKGDIPEGLLIRHTCDNPACVNPEHLLVGTYKDNREDCVRRNRQAKGKTHVGYRNLTWEKVEYIRNSPLNNSEVARELKIDPSSVSKIRAYKQWRLP